MKVKTTKPWPFTTMAISVLAGKSSGIHPQFSEKYERRTFVSLESTPEEFQKLLETNKEILDLLKKEDK